MSRLKRVLVSGALVAAMVGAATVPALAAGHQGSPLGNSWSGEGGMGNEWSGEGGMGNSWSGGPGGLR